MKKFESILIMCVLLFIGFEILTGSESILSSVKFSLNIFRNNIFPSLFPFFILSEILIKCGFVEFMGNFFGNIMNKLFRINGKCAFVFFMSIISGNPGNAKYTRELYLNREINRLEATKVLCFSSFVSPLFILGACSILLNNKEVPLLILICHYLGNIITGVLIRNYHPSNICEKFSLKRAINSMHEKRMSCQESFGEILTNTITGSINTLLLILGVITVCLVFTTIIDNNISLNSTYQSVLNGFVEMTQGLKYISLEDLPLKLKSTLTVMIFSFGGLSVHLQIMSILSDTPIKYLPFLACRILASSISSLILYFSFDFFI